MYGAGQDPGLVPGTMVGEYRIEQIVGEGGMGQVYGAVHPVIGKRAAIKVLLPEICRNHQMVERFVMEARAVNQIGHPNIVDVFAFGELPDGRQYMVMEWLRGQSLSDRLKRGIPTIPETCEILIGISAALDAAHEKGIVHRDLKPHNVFLVDVRGQRPLVKLLDFGLVKLTDAGEDPRMERTRAGALLGTPAYMSPEQALGRGVDTRSDNYALGVVAFEMLTGRLPFIEDAAMALLIAHMQQQPPVPAAINPGIPPELNQLVLGLLAKDPAHRPTMQQAMGVLGYFRETTSPSGVPTSPGSAVTMRPPQGAMHSTLGHASGQQSLATPAPASSGKGKYVLAAIGVLAAAGIAIAVIASKGGDRAQPAAEPQPVATPTAPIDAVVQIAPPDAAVVVETPIDAAVPAVTSVEPKHKPKPTTRPKPKPTAGSATSQPKPPPDDDDGLIRVTPKK
jgi:serine/threonine-protein kinase